MSPLEGKGSKAPLEIVLCGKESMCTTTVSNIKNPLIGRQPLRHEILLTILFLKANLRPCPHHTHAPRHILFVFLFPFLVLCLICGCPSKTAVVQVEASCVSSWWRGERVLSCACVCVCLLSQGSCSDVAYEEISAPLLPFVFLCPSCSAVACHHHHSPHTHQIEASAPTP